jgi:hypothetical protein
MQKHHLLPLATPMEPPIARIMVPGGGAQRPARVMPQAGPDVEPGDLRQEVDVTFGSAVFDEREAEV